MQDKIHTFTEVAPSFLLDNWLHLIWILIPRLYERRPIPHYFWEFSKLIFSHFSLSLGLYITRAASFLTHIAAGTKPALFTCSYIPTNSYTERHVVGLETLLKIWGKTFTGKLTYVCVHYSPLIFLVFYTPGATKSSLCLREDSFFENQFSP